MIERIKQVIEYSQLSSAAFADNIGISRSGLTHLLTGRNQPSLDVARKILAKYPEISTEWLIMGMGEMMRNEDAEPVPNTKVMVMETAKPYPAENSKSMMQTDLFGEYENFDEPENDIEEQTTPDTSEDIDNVDDTESSEVVVDNLPPRETSVPLVRAQETRTRVRKSSVPKPAPANVKREKHQPAPQERKLEKIVFFYDDHSFEVYNA